MNEEQQCCCEKCPPPPDPVLPRCNIALPDGVYQHATLVIENGCIVEVREGEPFIYTPQPCCSTGGGSDGGGGTPTDGIAVAQSQSIQLTGDGTSGTPLTANVRVSGSTGNTLQIRADGLFAAGGDGSGGSSIVRVANSPSLNLSGTGTLTDPISGSVRIDPRDPDNFLTMTDQGLEANGRNIPVSADLDNITRKGSDGLISTVLQYVDETFLTPIRIGGAGNAIDPLAAFLNFSTSSDSALMMDQEGGTVTLKAWRYIDFDVSHMNDSITNPCGRYIRLVNKHTRDFIIIGDVQLACSAASSMIVNPTGYTPSTTITGGMGGTVPQMLVTLDSMISWQSILQFTPFNNHACQQLMTFSSPVSYLTHPISAVITSANPNDYATIRGWYYGNARPATRPATVQLTYLAFFKSLLPPAIINPTVPPNPPIGTEKW